MVGFVLMLSAEVVDAADRDVSVAGLPRPRA
jgi:hypothetical protein